MEQNWEILERVFSEALELPPEERPRFVQEQSGDNLWLRQELESLLAVPETKADAAFNSSTGLVRELLAALDSEYAVGREIGGYRIQSLISSGGMGIVYKAVEIATGEPVALKLLAPEDSQNPQRIRRLAREASVLGKLRHPGIVSIKEYRSQPGGHFLAMELVAGETLQTLLAAGPIPLRQALDWAAQMAAAVEAAHAQHVVHRDLKPSNVMIERATGRVKLLDFGLARMADAEPSTHTQTTMEGTVAGTFSYFSPEQANGGHGDERSDIFSFGTVFYEMIAGRRAFHRSAAAAAAAAVLTEPPDPLPAWVPRPVRAFIEHCLEKDPARRFASMRQVGEAIEELRNLERRGRLRPPVRRPTRLVATVAVAVLICAAAGAGAWRYSRTVVAAREGRLSIAVLPFTNLSADPANQYFADGLTDEITDLLARNRALRVSARTSASQFSTRSSDLRSVGRRLNVSNVLEGSVERSGDRIRIVAHLERVSDGSHIWSNTYERQTADLFAVQTELAGAIAGNLKAAEGLPAAPRHIPSAEAHDLYLKGRYELQQMTPASLNRAEADFQQAIDLDPAYAAAYSGLGTSRYNRAPAWTQLRIDADRKAAEDAFRKALELDPDQIGAHAPLAAMKMQFDWDWAGAERELNQALAGPPDANADTIYAEFLLFHGRLAEADVYLQRAQDLDPFGSSTLINIALGRDFETRYAEALEVSQKALAVAPDMLTPHLVIGAMYILQGHPEVAVAKFQELKQRFPQAQMYEAMAQASVGHREEALRLMRPFEEKYPNAGIPAQWFALVYAFIGDESKTVKWLERSADAHEWQVLNLAVNPVFAGVRTSPGFRALEKRLGLGE